MQNRPHQANWPLTNRFPAPAISPRKNKARPPIIPNSKTQWAFKCAHYFGGILFLCDRFGSTVGVLLIYMLAFQLAFQTGFIYRTEVLFPFSTLLAFGLCSQRILKCGLLQSPELCTGDLIRNENLLGKHVRPDLKYKGFFCLLLSSKLFSQDVYHFVVSICDFCNDIIHIFLNVISQVLALHAKLYKKLCYIFQIGT